MAILDVGKGMSFVRIDTKTGMQTQNEKGILEPFIIGTEPYNSDIVVLDSLGTVDERISGPGKQLFGDEY